jgi:hypothetical protein
MGKLKIVRKVCVVGSDSEFPLDELDTQTIMLCSQTQSTPRLFLCSLCLRLCSFSGSHNQMRLTVPNKTHCFCSVLSSYKIIGFSSEEIKKNKKNCIFSPFMFFILKSKKAEEKRNFERILKINAIQQSHFLFQKVCHDQEYIRAMTFLLYGKPVSKGMKTLFGFFKIVLDTCPSPFFN